MVGINNEAMFQDKEHDVEKLKSFLEEKKDAFRYTCFIDNQNHARDSKSRLFFFLPSSLVCNSRSKQRANTKKKKTRLSTAFTSIPVIFAQLIGVYNRCGYKGIPCLILFVNNVASYVGGPGEGFERALSNSLDAITMEKEE